MSNEIIATYGIEIPDGLEDICQHYLDEFGENKTRSTIINELSRKEGVKEITEEEQNLIELKESLENFCESLQIPLKKQKKILAAYKKYFNEKYSYEKVINDLYWIALHKASREVEELLDD